MDWRAGELVVRGKAGRQDRLPLPAEVGDALVAYLSRGRNPAGARHLFLTCRAPRGPIRADLVGDVVERACKRAGLPRVGPHRLRHALAGELLAPRRRVGRDQPGPSPSGPGHHSPLRQGRPGRAAAGGPTLAGNSPMSALEQALVGLPAAAATPRPRSWPKPVGCYRISWPTSMPTDCPTVTIEAALAWAQQSTTVTGDDRRAAADDSRPRLRPLPVRHRRRAPRCPPFGSDAAPAAVAPAVHLLPGRYRRGDAPGPRSIESPLRAATYDTLIGLLASSGLRIGEAIKLDRSDVDWAEGVLLIRESKFGKSRLVPLQTSTMQALADSRRSPRRARSRDRRSRASSCR